MVLHDVAVADVFGFHAVQLGFPEADLLRANRIPHKFRIWHGAGADLRAAFDALPLATQSVDLVVLPHVLEFAEFPHRILREVDRVMMPEGRVIITGFNPWSLWGVRRWLRRKNAAYPWRGNFISLLRIKDWLSLLGFEVSAARLACYVPPVTRDKWIRRFGFLEDAGDRWWAVGGGVYVVQAIKRVQGMRILTAPWVAKRAENGLAAAPRSAGVPKSRANLRVVK